jgi:hypothetical protein
VVDLIFNIGKKLTKKKGRVNPVNNIKDYSHLEDITYKEIEGKLNPKEPIYCFCNYVSHGNMVKCDNLKCPREWFHFYCVGLRNFPKGKWFCSTSCANAYKKIK